MYRINSEERDVLIGMFAIYLKLRIKSKLDERHLRYFNRLYNKYTHNLLLAKLLRPQFIIKLITVYAIIWIISFSKSLSYGDCGIAISVLSGLPILLCFKKSIWFSLIGLSRYYIFNVNIIEGTSKLNVYSIGKLNGRYCIMPVKEVNRNGYKMKNKRTYFGSKESMYIIIKDYFDDKELSLESLSRTMFNKGENIFSGGKYE